MKCDHVNCEEEAIGRQGDDGIISNVCHKHAYPALQEAKPGATAYGMNVWWERFKIQEGKPGLSQSPRDQLIEEMEHSYINHPYNCPFCKTPEIQTESPEVGDGGISQEVRCLKCDRTWTDIYSLVGLAFETADIDELLKEGEAEPEEPADEEEYLAQTGRQP